MEYDFIPKGVCSRKIHLEMDDDIIKSVRYEGGCSGNTQGIGALIAGMNIDEAIKRLSGIRCGGKPTSCPDQLAQLLKLVQAQK